MYVCMYDVCNVRTFACNRVSPDPQALLAHQAALEIPERG